MQHCLYLLNAAYSDPAFTSAEDTEDPMVIMQLDVKNAFGCLCARLVLDVLSGKDQYSAFIHMMGPRIISNSKRGVYKGTAQNS